VVDGGIHPGRTGNSLPVGLLHAAKGYSGTRRRSASWCFFFLVFWGVLFFFGGGGVPPGWGGGGVLWGGLGAGVVATDSREARPINAGLRTLHFYD